MAVRGAILRVELISKDPLPIITSAKDLRLAGYTGSLSDMRRQNLLSALGLTEPQGSNNDLELRYYRLAGKLTGSLMDARHQGP